MLPLTLVSYTAKVQNNYATLNWKTSSENNNGHFVIAKSTNGTNFNELAKVNAKNANGAEYVYTDYNATNGTNYYRLTQFDLDGKTTELGVQAVKIGLADSDVKLYPNPTEDYANLSFEANKYNLLVLTGINGNKIESQPISRDERSVIIDLTNLPAGSYLVTITGKLETIAKKIIRK